MAHPKPPLRPVEGAFAPARCPSAPSWLDAHAKREWRRVAPILFARGMLAADTQQTLESYCVTVSMVRRYQAQLEAEGDTLMTPHGLKRHPLAGALINAMREARLLAVELGLTPGRRPASAAEGKGDGWADDSDLLA